MEESRFDVLLDGETPTALIPKMGEFPISNSAFYRQLVMTEAAGGSGKPDALEGAVDPFSPAPAPEQLPTTGVLLTFEQGWYQQGLALGELRKSLSLAPGEVTKLAVIDWRRQSRSTDSSSRTDTDVAASVSNEGTNVESVQRGVSNRTERGFGLSLGSSSHIEAGGSMGGLFASASASASHSSHMGMTATASTGTTDVSAEAAKSVQRATEQMAQSTRSSRATQVIEISESESQSTSTRVVANYNHAHALTMQYFEVLQIYRLGTKVVRADRCVFIPMEPLKLDDPATYANDAAVEALREVLQAFGAVELDKMVADFHDKAPNLVDANQALEDETGLRQAGLNNMERVIPEQNQAIADATAEYEQLVRDAPEEFIPVGATTIVSPAYTLYKATTLDPAKKDLAELRNTLLSLQRTRDWLVNRLEEIKIEQAENLRLLEEKNRLFGILARHETFLNQQMWMRIDDHQWHRKLAGKAFPHGEYKGQEIGGLINPTPVGYFGNYVAFTWEFPVGAEAQAEAFEDQYAGRTTTTTTIALPTEGVFAEAVLGQANSAEKIDITRFWNWQDSPIPILPPSLGPVSTDSRAGNVVAPTGPIHFGPSIAKLREDLGIDADVDDSTIMAALQSAAGTNSQAALIGAAVTAGITASNNAAEGAGRAGQRTIDAMKNVQDFTVGLANSEVGKIAAQAVAAGATGGASTVGGLINAASKAQKVINLTTAANEPADETAGKT